jgi:plastocyanin
MHAKAPFSLCVAMAVVVAAVSCVGGGSSSTPSSPSPTPTPTPTPSTGATITITSSGASPRSVTVSTGSRVTFVNNDSGAHDMSSDPHPSHTNCPEINQVGFLTAGQSRQTGNLNTPRTCGFHDHNRPTDASLLGTIVIQ